MSRSATAQLHESLRSVTEIEVTVLGVYTQVCVRFGTFKEQLIFLFSFHPICFVWYGTRHSSSDGRKGYASQSLQHQCSSIQSSQLSKIRCYRLLVEQLPPFLIKLDEFPSFNNDEQKRKLKSYLSFGFPFFFFLKVV